MIDQGKYLATRTRQDILTVAHLLEDEPTEEIVRQKIRKGLKQQRAVDDESRMVDATIRLGARLLLMVDIGSLPAEVSGRLSLPWTQNSLRESLYSYFDKTQETFSEGLAVGTDLTARNIDRISGIEIALTDNLVDHLRLVEKDTKLCIFHHVSFLKWMKYIQRYALSVNERFNDDSD